MSPDELRDEIIEHAESPYHYGQCEGFTHQGSAEHKSCGDSVTIQLRIDESGRVVEAWFDGDGCNMSQASASMLVQAIEGRLVSELPTARDWLNRFAAVTTPKKRQCVLLAIEALATINV